MPEMALRFILNNKDVATIIPGMRKTRRVDESVEFFSVQRAEESIAAFRQAILHQPQHAEPPLAHESA